MHNGAKQSLKTEDALNGTWWPVTPIWLAGLLHRGANIWWQESLAEEEQTGTAWPQKVKAGDAKGIAGEERERWG